MKYLILLVLASTIFSCGPNYHLRMSDKHIKKAIAKGAIIKPDTVYGVKEFKFPEVNLKFEPRIVEIADRYKPIIVTRDSIQIKIQWKKGRAGGPDTLSVDAKIPEKTVKASVPIAVSNTVVSPRGFLFWFQFMVLSYVLGFLTRHFFLKLKSF